MLRGLVNGLRAAKSELSSSKAYDQIAAELHQYWVEDKYQIGLDPEKLHLPRECWLRFREKAHLYCESAIMHSIVIWDHKKLLAEYEKIVFPSEPTPSGLRKLANIKDAVSDIFDLYEMMTNGKHGDALLWSRDWLKEITNCEVNPGDATMFLVWFLAHLTGVAGTFAALKERGIL